MESESEDKGEGGRRDDELDGECESGVANCFTDEAERARGQGERVTWAEGRYVR